MSFRDLTVNNDQNIYVNTIRATSTTNSTSVSTGSAVLSGGLAVSKDIRVGGTIYASPVVNTDTVGLYYTIQGIHYPFLINRIMPDAFIGPFLGYGIVTTLQFVNWKPAGSFKDFCVHFRGWIKPLYTETYTFYLTANECASLYIDNVLIGNSNYNEVSNTVSLDNSIWYNISLEWGQSWYSNSASVQWSSASQAKEVITGSVLKCNPSGYQSLGTTQFDGSVSVLNNFYLSTVGGTPSPLNYYQEGEPFSYQSLGAITSPNLTGTFTRLNNTVFVTFDNVIGSSVSNTYINTNIGSVPTKYRPSVESYCPVIVVSNSANVLGTVIFRVDGSIFIFVNGGDAFIVSGNAGIRKNTVNYTL
jgi:hypothetical protein